jgi:hypothetical protein
MISVITLYYSFFARSFSPPFLLYRGEWERRGWGWAPFFFAAFDQHICHAAFDP